MTIATRATLAAVLAALLLYFRSAARRARALLVADRRCRRDLRLTELAIGHLNLASAFLSSIVVGNGINFGIIVLGATSRSGAPGYPARRRSRREHRRDAHRAPLAAALAAGVAYCSLVVDELPRLSRLRHHRRRRDGAAAGSRRTRCCPPASPSSSARGSKAHPRAGAGSSPREAHAALAGGAAAVAIGALLITGAAGVATWKYLQIPYEDNFRNLRAYRARASSAPGPRRAHRRRLRATTSRAASCIARRRSRGRQDGRARASRPSTPGKDPDHQRLAAVKSIDDVPADQAQKLVRPRRPPADHRSRGERMLSDADRDDAGALRTPADLAHSPRPTCPTRWPGPSSRRTDARPAHPRRRGSASTRGSATTSSSSPSARRGARPRSGRRPRRGELRLRRRDRARWRATARRRRSSPSWRPRRHRAPRRVRPPRGHHPGLRRSGTLALLAGAWLLGLKVNFLDFVALPITIGIGVDYAVNIVARAHRRARQGRPTIPDGAVVLCARSPPSSGTDRCCSPPMPGSVRSAAILGEATCLLAALLIAPVLARRFTAVSRGP